MSKKFLNTLSIEEIKERFHKGEKLFNELDENTYVKYVDGLGICKFRKDTDELLAVVIALTSFHHLYFEDQNEDYSKMLGCIGWFWDNSESYKLIGILTEYRGKGSIYPFCRNRSAHFANFRPAKKSELKFWEDEE